MIDTGINSNCFESTSLCLIERFFASNFRLFANHFLCIFKEYSIEEAGEDKQ